MAEFHAVRMVTIRVKLMMMMMSGATGMRQNKMSLMINEQKMMQYELWLKQLLRGWLVIQARSRVKTSWKVRGMGSNRKWYVFPSLQLYHWFV